MLSLLFIQRNKSLPHQDKREKYIWRIFKLARFETMQTDGSPKNNVTG